MRSMGASLASASNWLCRFPSDMIAAIIFLLTNTVNGIAVTVTPIGLASIGWKYYLVWAVLNASFIPMIYFLYPETNGLSLEEVDHIFSDKGYGWDCLTQGVKESIAGTTEIPNNASTNYHPGATNGRHIEDKEKALSETEKWTSSTKG